MSNQGLEAALRPRNQASREVFFPVEEIWLAGLPHKTDFKAHKKGLHYSITDFTLFYKNRPQQY